MSSRLLSMKFMQRGIASSSATSSPSAPRTEDVAHATKRRKVDGSKSPALGRDQPPAGPKLDEKAVRDALLEEERRRQAAIAKQAAELGDSHWVLDFPAPSPASSTKMPKTPLKIVQVGFAQIDSADEDDAGERDSKPLAGAAAIRRFNMEKKKKQTKNTNMGSEPEPGSGSESESEEDYSGSDNEESSNPSSPNSGGGVFQRGRQTSSQESKRKRAQSEASARRSAERSRAHEFSAKRRKKDVKLNMPTSISSANSFGPSHWFRRSSRKNGH